MLNILKLFGQSPFSPLQLHMQKVANCVGKIKEIFLALADEDYARVEKLAAQISELEHEADLTKNDIRNHLTKGLFLLIDRRDLLDILSIQDSIADKAEDISVLLTIRNLKMESVFQPHFNNFLEKNIESFQSILQVIQELDELLETSFGGLEAEKVKKMVEHVAYLEHEADLLQLQLLKRLFNSEKDLAYPVFQLWLKIFEEIGSLSNLSERLGNRIRMLLEVK
ncbi:MAG: TIGR00153 family protein [Chlamydiales bacterium]|nr:TIGR00153 family protein [Chlamydiales bacterium]